MPLTSSIKLRLEAEHTNQIDLGVTKLPVNFSRILNLANGTGADQADDLFTDKRTLADGASESLDLAGGLTDAFGNTITLTKVKALIIIASGDNTTDLTIGAAATNAFADMFADATDALVLKPGGMFMLTAPDVNGYAVTADTCDLLKVANGAGAAATYEIVIIGV